MGAAGAAPIGHHLTPPTTHPEEPIAVMAAIPVRRPRRLGLPRPTVLVGIALLIVAGSYAWSQTPRSAPAAAAPGAQATAAALPIPGAPTGAAEGSLSRIEGAIGVWSANLARDGADFVSATNLAQLYVARARLTGAVDDYTRASAAIERAIAAYPQGLAAQELRAQLLFATHDFAGARSSAAAIVDRHPNELAALATVGDAQLELGNYAAAQEVFATLAARAPGAAVTARQAHLAALRGQIAVAQRLAARAVTEATAAGAVPTDRSWYEYLAGYLAFQFGDLATARTQFSAAVTDWPGSYLALAGLARTRAAQGATTEAIRLYERAVAIVPQPEFLAALGDLYALRGDAAAASERYDLVRAIGHLQSIQAQVYNRQLVLFDANHGEQPAEALRLAQRELAVRKDVYGWDAYAWALYAAGRFADADRAMASARALHTVDPLLDYHAGMIAAALGRTDEARHLLAAALGRNPGFDPLQASRARTELAELGGGAGR
jgi:tetratricopeptide (TPR) repeat protein